MREQLDSIIIGTIRTIVPSFVTVFIGMLSSYGFEFDEAAISGAAAFLVALFIGVYYAVVRVAALKFPALEWLLGYSKKPVYTEAKKEV